MTHSESTESDDKQLIEEEVANVAIKLDENPPPYRQHEYGLRAYPTNRVYAWLRGKGQQTLQQPRNPNRNERRISGLATILLSIPVIMLLVLGVYLLMSILFWCPNCGHRRAHVIKVEPLNKGAAELDRHIELDTHKETKMAEKTSEHEVHPQMDEPETLSPFEPLLQLLPSMFGPPPQKEGDDDEYPIVTERRWFFLFPRQEPEDQPEPEDQSKQAKEKETKEDETAKGLEDDSDFPSKLFSAIKERAGNFLSSIHNFFTMKMANDLEGKDSEVDAGQEKEKEKKDKAEEAHSHDDEWSRDVTIPPTYMHLQNNDDDDETDPFNFHF